MTVPVLEAQGLGYAVDGRWLLRDARLAVAAGEFVAVVGPNGAGKTTLLRLLAGVRPCSAGRVTLGGRPLASIGRAQVARQLAYLPQNTWTDFEITVADTVALGRLVHAGPWRSLRRADVDAVHAAMRRVGVEALAGRTLPTLSGGERQRAFIARALCQGAPILVLDEPTTSLDVGHQLEVMDLLRELHREGHSIVAAVHDLGLVWQFAGRAVLVDRGRIVADGRAREVLRGEAIQAAFGVRIAADPAQAFLHITRER